MKNEIQSHTQLMAELDSLRHRVAELEAQAAKYRQTEKALRESEVRFRSLAENLPDTVHIVEFPSLETFYWNHESFLGYTISELNPPDSAFRQAIHPDDQDRLLDNWQQMLQGQANVIEYRMRRKGGGWEWLRSRKTVLTRDADGIPTQVLVTLTIITEQKQAEEALAQEHNLLRTLIDNLPDYIYVKDRRSRFLLTNSLYLRSLGLASYEQIIGKSDFDFWPAEVAEKLYSQEQTLFQTGQPLLDYEEPLTKLDGQKGWVSTTKIPLRDNQGNIVGLVGVGRDITEYKRAQEAIAVSRDTLQRLIQQLPIGVEIFDTQGFTIGMNDALMRIFGITEPEKVLGHFNLFTDVMAAQTGTQAAGRQALAGQVVHLPEVLFDFRLTDTRFAQAQGQAILAVTFFPVRNANNEIVQVVALNEDITARKQLEERLRRAQKLEAVGQLAGGIAHNFNNMLTAIMGYTGLSLEALPSDHPIRPDLEGIQKTAQRAARLTQQLLAFTRSQIIQPKVVNLNDLVDEMSGLVRQLIGEAIELVISPAPDLGLVKVDPGQFEQILVNLVVNASDAMPDGGRLLIETQNAIVDAAYAGHYPDVIPGDYVVVAVTDSGHGMSEEVKAHLFEPFFTTKEVGRGTGLGLATCFGIVKQHNGHITVYSEPGQGATFKIYLPRVEASLVRATLSHHSVPLAHGAETIRLAEDEIMVRERLDKNDDQ